MIGGEHHADKAAIHSLLHIACDHYQGVKPPECAQVFLQVYYSASDPKSVAYFRNQLVPNYKNLGPRVKLDLIPYNGPAKTRADPECNDHACKENKLQACLVKHLLADTTIDQYESLVFMACIMNHTDLPKPDNYREYCDNLGVQHTITDAVHCLEDPAQNSILTEMANKAARSYQTITKVPWVEVNGVRSEVAETSLARAACDQIAGDRPDECVQAMATPTTLPPTTTTRKPTTRVTTKASTGSTVKATTKASTGSTVRNTGSTTARVTTRGSTVAGGGGQTTARAATTKAPGTSSDSGLNDQSTHVTLLLIVSGCLVAIALVLLALVVVFICRRTAAEKIA